MKKQKKKYRTTTTSTSGKEVPCLQVVVPRPSKKPLVATWGGISLVHKRKAIIEDKPYKVYGGRTELVKDCWQIPVNCVEAKKILKYTTFANLLM